MVEGGMKIVKYLLFIFNLIFFISGLLLIVIGAVIWTNFQRLFVGFEGSSIHTAVLLIVVGAVIFVVAFFGCCGAIRENYCMIVTFAAFLCLVLILEFAAAIGAFVMRNKLGDVVEQALKSNIGKYLEDESVTITWDNLQKELVCCGAANYTDWHSNSHLNMSVPKSCCIEKDCNVTGMAGAPPDFAGKVIHTFGCTKAMSDWATGKVYIIGGVAAALTFVQVLGIILAICLARGIKKNYEFA